MVRVKICGITRVADALAAEAAGADRPVKRALATAEPEDRPRRSRLFTILLFSLFVEHVSLFGQFLIMKAFDKARQLFKGIANIVEATSKEEQLHGLLGYHSRYHLV